MEAPGGGRRGQLSRRGGTSGLAEGVSQGRCPEWVGLSRGATRSSLTHVLCRFKATLWLSEEHPLSLGDQVTPIIDLMAISNAHFAKLRDFITLRLPPGFPVKIGEGWSGAAKGLGQLLGVGPASGSGSAVSSQRSPFSTCSMPASPSATCAAVTSP